MRPYIGITDFTSVEQVDLMKLYLEDYPHTQYLLHIGVMTSYKQIHGMPSKWQYLFPQLQDIAPIFARDDVYHCLHYADYDNHSLLRGSLTKAIGWGGDKLHALQLDMIWPNADAIRGAIEDSKRSIEIILQINTPAMEACQNKPAMVVERLKRYKSGAVHRVLLDKSMGQGRRLDARGLLPFVCAIRDAFPDIGIGVAGGLSSGSLFVLDPLVKEHPQISIDAQSRLRPSGSALEPIHWDMAGLYLKKSLEYFSRHR